MRIDTDWVSPPQSINGLDNLGCQAPCVLIYSQLMPGITNVTDRARYYSFYPWVLWSLDKRYPKANADTYVELYRRADCLFTLIAAQRFHVADDIKQAETMVGRLQLVPALDKPHEGCPLVLSDYSTLEETPKRYFKNKMGGLGQYYVGQLAELELCAKTTDRPWIKYTIECGEVIAEAIEDALPAQLFWDAVDKDLVDTETLKALSAFCPTELPASPDEHQQLLDIFFARPKYLSRIEEKDVTTQRQKESIGAQRRRSLALILHLGKALAAQGKETLSEDMFRAAVYTGTLHDALPWELPETLVETRALWSIYERNDLLSVACLTAFAACLKQILADAAQEQTLFASVESFASHFGARTEVLTALKTMEFGSFGELVQAVVQSGPQLQEWQSPKHEFSLAQQLITDWRGAKKPVAYLIAGALQLLALLAAREAPLAEGYSNLVIQTSELRMYPINLVSFRERTTAWNAMPLQQVVSELVAWCLNTHLSVALRKLWQTGHSSFHLRPAENGLHVVGDIPPPVRTMPRVWQALRILEDLGALTQQPGVEGHLIPTPAGELLLEEASA
jgi:hypothetical protein